MHLRLVPRKECHQASSKLDGCLIDRLKPEIYGNIEVEPTYKTIKAPQPFAHLGRSEPKLIDCMSRASEKLSPHHQVA